MTCDSIATFYLTVPETEVIWHAYPRQAAVDPSISALLRPHLCG